MSNKSPVEIGARSFSAEQRGVLTGIALAVIAPPLAIAGLLRVLADIAPVPAVAFALAALPLAACIGRIAAYRFTAPAAIDGSVPPGDAALGRLRAILANTLEQTVLFVLALLALAPVLPPSLAALPIAMAIWFVIARAIFAATYAKGAAARAFGFAATFYPSLLGLVAALVLALR
ncbi:MAPEG family protein [Aureimonas sp. AU12]|uniref:MAPEG family protein n=1 Tax=Aureimonas sp. AU12 TaxID=1638161 RepID=UPI000781EC2C|nr:MAPEG family protein [Aureimonas sp. AU12]